MSDDTPTPDATQDTRLTALETEAREARDHRTVVKTLLGLASAAALIVTLGAISVRDETLATAARVTNVESRVADVESAARSRATDDRGTRQDDVRPPPHGSARAVRDLCGLLR